MRHAASVWSYTLVSFLLSTSVASVALAEDPEPGVEYASGKVLQDKNSGISFVVPGGWFGTLPMGETAFRLHAKRRRGEIYVVTDRVSLEEARHRLENPEIPGSDLALLRQDPVREKNHVFEANYNIMGSELRAQTISTWRDGVLVSITSVYPPENRRRFTKAGASIQKSLSFQQTPRSSGQVAAK